MSSPFFSAMNAPLNLKIISRVVAVHQPHSQGHSHHILKPTIDGVPTLSFKKFDSVSDLWSLSWYSRKEGMKVKAKLKREALLSYIAFDSLTVLNPDFSRGL